MVSDNDYRDQPDWVGQLIEKINKLPNGPHFEVWVTVKQAKEWAAYVDNDLMHIRGLPMFVVYGIEGLPHIVEKVRRGL